MTPRQRIVEALATVGSVGDLTVTALDSEPDAKYAGAAWPVLREMNRDGTLCSVMVRTYDVFVVLSPATKHVAADQAESVIERLVDAIEDHVGEWVEPAETVQIAFDNTTMYPGVRVRVTPDTEG